MWCFWAVINKWDILGPICGRKEGFGSKGWGMWPPELPKMFLPQRQSVVSPDFLICDSQFVFSDDENQTEEDEDVDNAAQSNNDDDMDSDSDSGDL